MDFLSIILSVAVSFLGSFLLLYFFLEKTGVEAKRNYVISIITAIVVSLVVALAPLALRSIFS